MNFAEFDVELTGVFLKLESIAEAGKSGNRKFDKKIGVDYTRIK